MKLSLRKKALFSIVAVILFFSIAETVCRIFIPPAPPRITLLERAGERFRPFKGILFEDDPILFWRLKPYIDVPSNYWGDRTNSLGLRDDPIGRKQKNEVRILCLGESTTYGMGTEFIGTYPYWLEKFLNENAGGKKYNVINAGAPGYTSYQGLVYLTNFGLKLEPDIVLISFGNNDVQNWSGWETDLSLWNNMGDEERAKLIKENYSRLDNFLSGSRLYIGMKKVIHQIKPPSREEARLSKKVRFRPRVTPEEFKANLEEMIRIARDRGIKSVLIIYPRRWQVEPDYHRRDDFPDIVKYQEVMRTVAREQNVPVVDCIEPFRMHKDRKLYVDSVHANYRGYRIVAEEIYKTLGNQNWFSR